MTCHTTCHTITMHVHVMALQSIQIHKEDLETRTLARSCAHTRCHVVAVVALKFNFTTRWVLSFGFCLVTQLNDAKDHETVLFLTLVCVCVCVCVFRISAECGMLSSGLESCSI
jgi:hypothetical protein